MTRSKIRILYTIPNFDTAGSGKVVYDLVKGLNPDLFEVFILCHHSKGLFFKEVEALGVPIHFLQTTVPLRPYLSLYSRLQPYRNFIKTHQIDLVHSWHWSSDWTEILAARLGGARYVYTKKAMNWGNIHWKIKSFLADWIVTINADMRAFFPYKKQQKLIPIGLDMDLYSRKHFPQMPSSGSFRILTVANLVPVKNIELLLEAMYLLRDLNIELYIVGDSETPYAAFLQEEVLRLGLTERVVFTGKQVDVRPLLAQADLEVMCSHHEGLGMALLEAMSMEVPVLGSDVPGINFILKDFPEYRFESGNASELAQKISYFYNLNSVERNAIGETLRSYVTTHFSLASFIAQHEALYRQLAQKRR